MAPTKALPLISGRMVFTVCVLLTILPFSTSTFAQQEQTGKGSFLLTIFLHHDQSKNLESTQEELRKNGFYKNFPPEGVEVVSWYVMMGIGQVVTLRVPAEKLREVNLAIEHGAWGAFRTDFYPTYDYKQIWEEQKRRMQ